MALQCVLWNADPVESREQDCPLRSVLSGNTTFQVATALLQFKQPSAKQRCGFLHKHRGLSLQGPLQNPCLADSPCFLEAPTGANRHVQRWRFPLCKSAPSLKVRMRATAERCWTRPRGTNTVMATRILLSITVLTVRGGLLLFKMLIRNPKGCR